MSDVHFPGESAAYRAAREELLRAEIDLRRKVEEVAALRRKLPLGGRPPEDYAFEEGEPPRTVRLSELFAPGQDTLVLYNYMFGPAMKQPCPMCTSMLDALVANGKDIQRNVSLAIVARSPVARILELARSRGWSGVRLLSSANNDFNRVYLGESAEGKQQPLMHVFVKRDGVVHHFWSSETLFAKGDAGQDTRHVDLFWPLWHVLDLTPGGRGDFRPQVQY